jgi:hypothetical protein
MAREREQEVGMSGARARRKKVRLLSRWGVALARGSDMCWGLYSLVLHGVGELWAWEQR